jgi:CRISPR-associated endonuclease Csn1
MSGGLVFGFDLGTNSIGWAVLREAADGTAEQLVDAGVRIFNRAVEDKTPTPKNLKRRMKRLARRVLQRRARRRTRLQNYLIKLGLLPESVRDIIERERVLNSLGDPYLLRAKAIQPGAALTPYALGRVIVHLGMRRGFQSNRRTALSDMEDDPDLAELLGELEGESEDGKSEADKVRLKEESEFKAEIAELQHQIDAAGALTLGAYLASIPLTERKRNRRVGREMIRHELSLVLEAQAGAHAVLTEAVREEIEDIIFYQRPPRWDTATIGTCSLEPKLRRTARGRLEFQQFRVLQDLNHLTYDYPEVDKSTGEVLGINLRLTDTDREKLLARLDGQRSMTWGALRKELGLPKTVKFNLETASKDKGLTGNTTACTIRRVMGDARWESLGDAGQHDLVEDIFKFEKKSALKTRLVGHWKLDLRTAIGLATMELEPGYGNLSLKATRCLLPHMRKGMIYSDARVAAGYGYEPEEVQVVDRLPPPRDLRNPVVNKALHEFRRVCNALIAQYGKPKAIRIEMLRELTMNKKRKQAFERQQRANKEANDKAKEQYAVIRSANAQLGLPEYPRRDDLIKYRLWLEQRELSAYSGKAISMTQLFSSAVEIDHILPYSRSLDDSYMNKVLAFATENRDKGNRTPWEMYAGSVDSWEQLIQRIKGLPLPKRNRFLRQKLDSIDDFIGSQLTDSAYISREVTGYVRPLGCDVSVTKGTLTAWLRRRWGLDTLLGSFEKNRTDHRHHTIDAVVTAAVNRRLYKQIVHLAEQDPTGGSPDVVALAAPYPNFRAELEARLASLIVSHDPIRKLTGALHQETAYSVQSTKGGKRICYRKPLGPAFDSKQIDKVADPALQEVLRDHLKRHGGDPKAAFSSANLPVIDEGKGPVRRVRIVAAESFNPDSFLVLNDRRGHPKKALPYGNNHHVEVVRDRKSGKVKGEFVTNWEAAQRIRRRGQPAVQRDHGAETEFLAALHINEQVEITAGQVAQVYRVQKLDPGGKRLVLRLHTAATLDDKTEEVQASISKLVVDFRLKPLRLNVLGTVVDDQTNR